MLLILDVLSEYAIILVMDSIFNFFSFREKWNNVRFRTSRYDCQVLNPTKLIPLLILEKDSSAIALLGIITDRRRHESQQYHYQSIENSPRCDRRRRHPPHQASYQNQTVLDLRL